MKGKRVQTLVRDGRVLHITHSQGHLVTESASIGESEERGGLDL